MDIFGQKSVASLLSILVSIIYFCSQILAGLVLIFGLICLSISLFGGYITFAGIEIIQSISPQTLGLATLSGLIVFIGIAFITGALRKILATLVAGDPFVPENASRLRRIAFAIMFMELARYAANAIIRIFIPIGEDGQISSSLPISFAAWVAIIALFILSQVFAEGTRLREADKMTI